MASGPEPGDQAQWELLADQTRLGPVEPELGRRGGCWRLCCRGAACPALRP